MNTRYGVSDQQSGRTGYHRFQANSGFYGIDSSLTWTHQLSEHWGTIVSADYTFLGKHVEDSPIVLRRNQTSAIVGINYTF